MSFNHLPLPLILTFPAEVSHNRPSVNRLLPPIVRQINSRGVRIPNQPFRLLYSDRSHRMGARDDKFRAMMASRYLMESCITRSAMATLSDVIQTVGAIAHDRSSGGLYQISCEWTFWSELH